MSLLSHPLQAFMAVAETGAVHRAAEVIGLTQTGVTQRIRTLEMQLGVSLFTRSRKGMRLTSEGEALLQYCMGAKELEGALLSRVRGENDSEETSLVITGPTSIMCTRVTEACTSLAQHWSNIVVHLEIDDFRDRIAAIKSGKSDLAIVNPQQVPNEMDSKRLKPVRYVLVASAKWRQRALKEILFNERIIDFFESDQTTLHYLKKFHLEPGPKKRLYINENLALVHSFKEGLGFGTLSQEIAKPYIEAGDLIALNRGQAIEEANALVWYPRPQMPAYLRALIGAIH